MDTPSQHMTIDEDIKTVEDVVKQSTDYVASLRTEKGCSYYSIDMHNVMTEDLEVEYEAMDVLALARTMRYDAVVVEGKQPLRDLLEASGLTTYDSQDISYSLPRLVKLLNWGGSLQREFVSVSDKAYYVRVDEMKAGIKYFPSLLYGRAFVVAHEPFVCSRVFSGYDAGVLAMRSIVMMAKYSTAWFYRKPYFLDDPLYSYFCVPIVRRPGQKKRQYLNLRPNFCVPTDDQIETELFMLLRKWPKQALAQAYSHPSSILWDFNLYLSRYKIKKLIERVHLYKRHQPVSSEIGEDGN